MRWRPQSQWRSQTSPHKTHKPGLSTAAMVYNIMKNDLVASYVPMIGPATSFAMGEGNTMISAQWEVFVWKEFNGATPA